MNKEKKVKRIGIDARFYGPIGKGLGRYTQQVADRLVELDRQNEYVIFLRRENFADFHCPDPRVKKVLADIKWYGWAEQIIFPFYIWRERLDLMHFPHFNAPIFCPVKFVITIHDLILIKFPTRRATTLGPLAYRLKNLAYKITIFLAVKRARKVLAVSEFTKNDLVRQLNVKAKKVAVIYEGIAELTDYSCADRFIQAPKELVKQPYLLYVGNAYPHKNLERLIKVFSGLSREQKNLRLALVGKDDYFYRRLKLFAKKFSAEIIFLGYVPDMDLKTLYRQALAYVFPSLYEGFGLPPLEAMANGLPVASSDKTCLPEILGRAALYFNPESEPDMKEKIALVIKDENLRQELKNRGYEQIKKYSWQACAKKTLAVYIEILNKL